MKDVGVSTEDLIEVYILYIRSVVEYCVVWHSCLAKELRNSLEIVRKPALQLYLVKTISVMQKLWKCVDWNHFSKKRRYVPILCSKMPETPCTERHIPIEQK